MDAWIEDFKDKVRKSKEGEETLIRGRGDANLNMQGHMNLENQKINSDAKDSNEINTHNENSTMLDERVDTETSIEENKSNVDNSKTLVKGSKTLKDTVWTVITSENLRHPPQRQLKKGKASEISRHLG